MSSGSSKNVIYKMCLEIVYLIYMYKKNLALNNIQWLIRHKTKPNQTTFVIIIIISFITIVVVVVFSNIQVSYQN